MRLQITFKTYYPEETPPPELVPAVLDRIKDTLELWGFTVSDVQTLEL